jgi:hypothetical protein
MTASLVFGPLERSGVEIDARATRLAGGLARLGIEDGDVVAVMLRNDPAYIDIIQGCRIAGAWYCQINWHFKRDEAGFILGDCGAKVLFIQPDLLAAIDSAVPPGVRVITVAHVPDEIAEYDAWLAAQAALRRRAAHATRPHGLHLGHHRPAQGRAPPATDGRAAGALGAGGQGGAGHLPRGAQPGLGAALPQRTEFLRPAVAAAGFTVRARREVRRRGHAGADRAPPHRHRLPGTDHVRAPACACRRKCARATTSPRSASSPPPDRPARPTSRRP